jgi:isoleucyl-tRNA synthetase
VAITAAGDDHDALASLGDDLRFVLITSAATVARGDALATAVTASANAKCERCWHYRADVGTHAGHPTLCGRCAANLFGSGEHRTCA